MDRVRLGSLWTIAVACALAIVLLSVSQIASATVVTVSWSNPTTYTDGSAMPGTDIGSTTVQYGSCSSSSPLSVATVAGSFTAQGGTTHAQSPDLPAGTYCFQAITNSLTLGSSAPSVAASETIAKNPGAPALGALSTQLVTSGTAIYLATQIPDGWAFTQVGTVQVGTPCDASQGVNTYNVVPQKGITVTWLTAVQPLSIVAQCH